IEENEIAELVTATLATVFPADPPRFMARTPHGYHDTTTIARDVAAGGFASAARIETLAKRSRAPSARHAAIAYCQGTPLRNEIAARDASRLAEATERCAEAIASRFGRDAIDAKIQAHVVVVAR